MIKTERLNGPNPDVDFDETLEEFRFKKDAVLTKTSHKELAVGNLNSSTGQVDANFNVLNSGTTEVYQGRSSSDIEMVEGSKDLIRFYDTDVSDSVDTETLSKIYWDTQGNIRWIAERGDMYLHPDGGSGDGTVYLQTDLFVGKPGSTQGELRNTGRLNTRYNPESGNPAAWFGTSFDGDNNYNFSTKDYIAINPPTSVDFDHFVRFRENDTDRFSVSQDGATTIGDFTWSYDSNNQEFVLTDNNDVELIRQPKAGSTQFLQGIDVAYPFETPEDSLTNFANAPNTTATSSGDTVGYNLSVNNQAVAQVSADSDGSGGIGDGKFVVRQAGGTPGTDEVQIYHDGANTNIESYDGSIRFIDSVGNILEWEAGLTFSGGAHDLGDSSQLWSSLYLNDNIKDSNNNELLSFTSTSAAVNNVDIANAATGNAPTISAVGDDADIDLALSPKGSGGVVIDNYTFSEDTTNNELVLTGPTGTELIRQPESGATEFLQGLDISYPLEMPQDSVNPFVNADVTASASNGTVVGYRFQVNSQSILEVIADSDGSGGITNRRINLDGRMARTKRATRNNVSSDIQTDSEDYFIGVDTSSGSYTITISSSDIEDGREIVIHDQGGNASGNNITIQTEGSETISGTQYGSDLSSITMDTDHESLTIRGAVDNASTEETNLYVV